MRSLWVAIVLVLLAKNCVACDYPVDWRPPTIAEEVSSIVKANGDFLFVGTVVSARIIPATVGGFGFAELRIRVEKMIRGKLRGETTILYRPEGDRGAACSPTEPMTGLQYLFFVHKPTTADRREMIDFPSLGELRANAEALRYSRAVAKELKRLVGSVPSPRKDDHLWNCGEWAPDFEKVASFALKQSETAYIGRIMELSPLEQTSSQLDVAVEVGRILKGEVKRIERLRTLASCQPILGMEYLVLRPAETTQTALPTFYKYAPTNSWFGMQRPPNWQ